MNLSDDDFNVVAMATRELVAYIDCLEHVKSVTIKVAHFRYLISFNHPLASLSLLRIRDGLRHILALSRLGNMHIQANEPWKLVKGSPDDM